MDGAAKEEMRTDTERDIRVRVGVRYFGVGSGLGSGLGKRGWGVRSS